MKKSFNILFGLSVCAILLTACSSGTVEADTNRHYVENTIHDINYDYAKSKTFITNKTSNYYIATIDDEDALQAANYIVSQVKAATECELEIRILADTDVVSSTECAIVIGSYPSFYAAGLTKTEKDIGITGYQIKTAGNAVYIVSDGAQGFQLGGLKFLELTLGYDLIYGDFIVYDRDGSQIPSMDIVERPDFDYRKIDDLDTTWRYGAGFTDNKIFMTVNGGWQYHNSFEYIPPSEYLEDHPNWYNTKYGGDKLKGQLCYTAHSHPEELDEMAEIAAAKMIEEIEAQPGYNNITFTIQDNYNMCTCYGDADEGWSETNPDPNSCLGKKKHYNGSCAGVTVEFVNKIDDIVQEHFKDSGREIYISLFAYHSTEIAPVEEKDGQYYAIDNLKANPHVAIFTAFISSNFINSFYDTTKNKETNTKAKSWNAVSNRLYAWIYETNFAYYFYPFNTFTSMHETLRFLKENNIQMVYIQGQHTATTRTAFNRLKLYLSSKLMVNVNLDVGPLIDKFFESYYGEGASYMREFYEEMVSWCLYQEARWPDVFTGSVSSGSTYLHNAEYWNESQLNKWENMVYKAIDCISSLEEQDPYKYQQMKDAMMVESIFPRWALCNLFTTSYNATDLRNKRLSFIADAKALNFDQYGENKELADFYPGAWGL